jgi:hypothetical protein
MQCNIIASMFYASTLGHNNASTHRHRVADYYFFSGKVEILFNNPDRSLQTSYRRSFQQSVE